MCYVAFLSIKTAISFSATTSDQNRSTTFLCHGQGGVDVVFHNELEVPTMYFSVSHLNLISKSASIAETITLRMEETNTPVELDYPICHESQVEDEADVVHLKHYIMPELYDGTVKSLANLEEEKDATFEARMKTDSNLVQLLPTLVAFPLVRLELSKSGMHIQGMDIFHMALADVFLPPSAFGPFALTMPFQ